MSDLIPYAGLIGTFVLLCGLLKFYIYYKQFNISILRFIEIGETITLFMDNLLGYMAIILPTSFNLAYIYKSDEPKIYSPSYSIFDTLKYHWMFSAILLAAMFVYAFLYHRYGKGVKTLDLLLLLAFITICIVGVPPLFIYVLRTCHHDFGTTINAKLLYLIFLCTMLTCFSIAAAIAETYKVKKHRFLSNVNITLKEGATLETSEINYFIGMTKNYFFIYDSKRKSCTVYKTENIDKLVFENYIKSKPK